MSSTSGSASHSRSEPFAPCVKLTPCPPPPLRRALLQKRFHPFPAIVALARFRVELTGGILFGVQDWKNWRASVPASHNKCADRKLVLPQEIGELLAGEGCRRRRWNFKTIGEHNHANSNQKGDS